MRGTELSAAISRLKATFPDQLQAPDPSALSRLLELVPDLPTEVLELYQEIDGMSPPRAPVHLMPAAEIADTVTMFRSLDAGDSYEAKISRYGSGRDLLLLFNDFGSNYWGLHLKSPYAPRGFVLNHEEMTAEPAFGSLARMLETMINHCLHGGLDCIDAPNDYPVLDAAFATEQDRALSRQLLKEHLAFPEKHSSAFAAMQLSHPDDTEMFAPLLHSDDMWVAEQMCRLVGLRRYGPAIQTMTREAAERGGNRIIGTIVALRDWPGQEAETALRWLYDHVEPGCRSWFPERIRDRP
jgi:hypothetical protein